MLPKIRGKAPLCFIPVSHILLVDPFRLVHGIIGVEYHYEYETYRCYRKISSKGSCGGQNVYKADVLNDAVEEQVRLFLSRIGSIPREHMVALASARNEEAFTVSYRQAEKEFENAQKQVAALEEQVVKALVGESQLDLGVVNSMLLKHRAKLEGAQQAMEEAKTRMEAEKANSRTATAQIDQLVSWAECGGTAIQRRILSHC